jgi:hypothetical protein
MPVGFRAAPGPAEPAGDGDGDGVTTGNRPLKLFGVTVVPGTVGYASGGRNGGTVVAEGVGVGLIGMPTRVAIEAWAGDIAAAWTVTVSVSCSPVRARAPILSRTTR